VINYEGRRFRSAEALPGESAEAVYRQEGDLVWAEIKGGDVRHGSLAGLCDAGGRVEFAYIMVRGNGETGETVVGRCVSRPEILADGRIRLHETWERFLPQAAQGESVLDEV
jgi:hypothetical protein